MFLPDRLTADAVPDLRDLLIATFAEGRPVLLQAETVVQVATAGVQVLVAASRQAERDGVAFRLVAPSPQLREACGDLGLNVWLQRWSET